MKGAWILTVCLSSLALAADTSAGYFRDVRPILQRQCQGCHQPNLKSGALDLTTFEAFEKAEAGGLRFGLARRPKVSSSST
jgi:mono/diheme cytochrome c family protein